MSFTEVGGVRVANTAAHELGHGLNASHDSSASCPASAKNIMAPSLTTIPKRAHAEAQWTFSSCSVESFKSFINR